ncbi:MAG: sorbosone dehydrogenase [Candidatus Rokuibacteriota bacterium]|nr:MAG: sorbosone dehydrogenase [Candidatus Rokubacteria bacterium]
MAGPAGADGAGTDGVVGPLAPGRRTVPRSLVPLVAVVLVGCVGLWPAPAQEGPIRLPPGFAIDVFAKDLGHPRFLAFDPAGTLLVSVPRAGRIVALPDRNGAGRADGADPVVEGLDLPHGLAFHGGMLYVAETGRVVRLGYDPATHRAVGTPQVVVAGLPARGSHWTRTIAFGPDGRLYVSVGSSCNVCEERDARRAAVTRYAADGTDGKPYATGLRNAVGLAFRPGTGELWATVNGRDWLGDDRPSEYVTRLEEGGFYGWPYCHWAGGILMIDPDLGSAERCRKVARPNLEYQAHSAPLGLAFYTGTQFPTEYRGNLFVALHGSWNRAVPTGYKVIRVRLDGATPKAEDFATGWLIGARAFARPVDLAVGPDGSLFLSDDTRGLVYRISYRGG